MSSATDPPSAMRLRHEDEDVGSADEAASAQLLRPPSVPLLPHPLLLSLLWRLCCCCQCWRRCGQPPLRVVAACAASLCLLLYLLSGAAERWRGDAAAATAASFDPEQCSRLHARLPSLASASAAADHTVTAALRVATVAGNTGLQLSSLLDLNAASGAPHALLLVDRETEFGLESGYMVYAVNAAQVLQLVYPQAVVLVLQRDSLPLLQQYGLPNRHTAAAMLQANFPAAASYLQQQLDGFTGPVLLGCFFYNDFPAIDNSSLLSHPRFHLMAETHAQLSQCEHSRRTRGLRWSCLLAPVGVDVVRWQPSLPRSRRCRPLVVLKSRDGLAAPADAVEAAMETAGLGQRGADYSWLQTAHDGSHHYSRVEYTTALRHAPFMVAYTPWDNGANFVQEARAMDVPVLYVAHIAPDWWLGEDGLRTGGVIHLQGDIVHVFGRLNYSDPAATGPGRFSWAALQADGSALLARLILHFIAELPYMQPREFMLRYFSYSACAQRIAEQLRTPQQL